MSHPNCKVIIHWCIIHAIFDNVGFNSFLEMDSLKYCSIYSVSINPAIYTISLNLINFMTINKQVQLILSFIGWDNGRGGHDMGGN